MSAHKPEEVHQLFAEAFQAADLNALMTLYEPNATLVPAPGQVVSGHAAIHEALSGFLALKAQFAIRVRQVLHSGDIALIFSKWTLSAKDADGNPIDMAGETTDVVRRQPDGIWLLVIDNPFGFPQA